MKKKIIQINKDDTHFSSGPCDCHKCIKNKQEEKAFLIQEVQKPTLTYNPFAALKK